MPCDVTDESGVSKAAAVAASAELTILVVGDASTASTAHNATPYVREVATVGEHFDRDDLDPAGAQMPLMRAVMKASKSVIIVMIGGRPMTFGSSALDGYNKMFTDASAVIAAWHPGEITGLPPALLLIDPTSLRIVMRWFLKHIISRVAVQVRRAVMRYGTS